MFERQVALTKLPAGLRLEVQYLLQCRRDDQLARCSVPTATRMVRVLTDLPVTSLLDWDESRWRTSFGYPTPKDASARALLRYGLAKLDELAFGLAFRMSGKGYASPIGSLVAGGRHSQ